MADQSASLEKAVTDRLTKHGQKPGMEEVRELLERALFLVREGYRPTPNALVSWASIRGSGGPPGHPARRAG
ncbi:hypothetical protein JFU37_08995 [Pseudomonas sp. TH41]|uniref:hypothetical protein n=1 Tax=Pseudomonas sp. TH41 TaxID=2796405 RepID=UPI001911AEAA|nr:hypothetical protein [Pseudomonas sp. TH41]MBK5352643.1 hypothetical protein [Pseudomonas sp. TH41]